METWPLGNTGIDVSPLGLGTVKFGRNQGVKYPRAFEIPPVEELSSLLDLARDLGVNFLDTAPAYGRSEEVLGRLLASRRREDWVLGSKVGEEFVEGESWFDFTPGHVRRSVERSLRRLGTDYLDLVLVHSDGRDLAILDQEGTLDALVELRREGLVRAVGMSTKTVEGGLRALEEGDVVMVTYNPLHTAERPVIDRACELGRGVLIKKGLVSGHLTSLETDEDPLDVAVGFVFEAAGVSSLVVGTIDPEHLRRDVEAVARHAGRAR